VNCHPHRLITTFAAWIGTVARQPAEFVSLAPAAVCICLGLGATVSRAQLPATPDASQPHPRHVWHVVAKSNDYPYSYADESGRPTGFAVDILDAVAHVMNYQVDRNYHASSGDIEQWTRNGESTIRDFIMQSPYRHAEVKLSTPYLILQEAFFVRSDDTRFADMDDLRTKHARIATGVSGENYALQHGIPITAVSTVPNDKALLMLANGDCDAVFMSRLSGLSLVRRLGLKNIKLGGPLDDDFTIHCGFIVTSGGDSTLATLNEGIANLHQNGQFDTIYQKWFGPVEPSRFTGEQVVIYVAIGLALLLVVTLWAFLRQRQLRQRIIGQAEELSESKAFLAEAQQFARIGHWQRPLNPNAPSIWSEETYHIFERDPRLPPPPIAEIIESAVGEDRKRWLDVIQRSRKESFDYALDVHIEPKPGINKIIHVHGRPVRNNRGQPTGFFGTVQDVTEWREAERAQRESAQLLRAIYDNAPFAMGVFELTGRTIAVVSVNPEARRLIGLPAQITPGHSFAELGLPPEQAAFWTELFTRQPTTTAPFKTTLRLNATRRDLAITLVPLGRASKHPRFCLIAEDITERVHKDAEIAQSRRLRAVGELVGGIAHEFNNLLTPILLKADALQHEHRQTALATELQIIIDAAIRAAEITRRLLTFQRKTDRKPEKIRLRSAIESDIELLRHAIDRRIRLDCTIGSDLPVLWLPGTDLHQIIVNLLLNARDTLVEKLAREPADNKWTPSIQIEAQVLPADAAVPLNATRAQSAPGGWVRLTLRDNGLGMPPDVLERIFEPFYTTKPVGQGTGLGLATVWHLVAEIGGGIDVNSTPGIGTAFNLFLPVRASTETANNAAIKTPAPAALPSTAHVLLVDDEDAVSNLVCEILQFHGHQVTTLANGRQAWEKLSAAPDAFDVIILDLNMPGLNGIELAKRARDMPFAGLIFVMSGRLSESDRAEFVRLRVDRIIEKPFTLDTFLAALAAFNLARPGKTETVAETTPASG
jgi:two-component system cell cycle sensor histidine kinase/response regulator CckA